MFLARLTHTACLALCLCLLAVDWVQGQNSAAIGSSSIRPFVMGFVPVVGGDGAVGGVSVDAQGVVSLVNLDQSEDLYELRQRSLDVLHADLRRFSPLRKISLRRLDQAILEAQRQLQPMTDEMRYLAGLQRVHYVFVFPEEQDIVLAGPAEGWRVHRSGHLVGQTTGQPTLRLLDLAAALRHAHRPRNEPLTCSIDPTEAGIEQLQRYLARRDINIDAATPSRLEALLGPQQITFGNLDGGSPWARTFLAADLCMKRLGMGLDGAEGLPSYVQLMRSPRAVRPQTVIPRWWLAASYEPLRRDPLGLAWQLQGQGVQVLAEEETLQKRSRKVSAATEWAQLFTERYDELARELPVLGELRGCIEMSVVATLLVEQGLLSDLDLELPSLLDEQHLEMAHYAVPQALASQAQIFRKDGYWVITVSGGVTVDASRVLERIEDDPKLVAIRQQAAAPQAHAGWWWD